MKTIQLLIMLFLLVCSTSCQKDSIEFDSSTEDELTTVKNRFSLWDSPLTFREHSSANNFSIRNYFRQSATTVFKNAVWRVTRHDYSGNLKVSKSDDGINWTSVSALPNGLTDDRIQLVAFNGELWLMGYRNTAVHRSSQPLYKSSDGVAWHSVPILGSAYAFPQNIFVFKKRLYMHVGRSLFYTKNGIKWIGVSHFLPNPVREITKMLVFKNKFYAFTFGKWEDIQGIVDPVEFWESTDGRSWSRLPNSGPFLAPKEAYSVTTFKGKLWAIGGSYFGPVAVPRPRSYSYTRYNEIWFTEDAVNWQKYHGNIPFKAISKHAATVFNDKLWLFDGTPDGRIISPTYEIGYY